MSEFHDDTRLAPVPHEGAGPHVFGVVISDRWAVGPGANGGYVAGMLARAVLETIPALAPPDNDWTIHSMAAHYLRPPVPGPAQVVVQPLRLGRAISIIDASLVRDEKILSTARFVVGSTGTETLDFTDRTPPVFPPPESLPREEWDNDKFIRARYDTRYAIGAEHNVAETSEVSGWIRTADHAIVDLPLAVALTDSWMPAAMIRLGFEDHLLSTLDLASHFFHSFDPPIDDWLCMTNKTTVSRRGFADIDTEIWSADGELLAQGRQLGLLVPRPDLSTL